MKFDLKQVGWYDRPCTPVTVPRFGGEDVMATLVRVARAMWDQGHAEDMEDLLKRAVGVLEDPEAARRVMQDYVSFTEG